MVGPEHILFDIAFGSAVVEDPGLSLRPPLAELCWKLAKKPTVGAVSETATICFRPIRKGQRGAALDRASSLLAKSSSAPESSTFAAATSTSITLSSAAIAGIVLGSVASAAIIGALIYLYGRSHSVASFIRYWSPPQGKAPPIQKSPYNYEPSPITSITPAAATSQPGYRNNELVSPLSPVLIQSSPSEQPWSPYGPPYVGGHHNAHDGRNFAPQAVELDAGIECLATAKPPGYF
ncbi:hypothetical protein V502_02995 [Pseudogymnoascus sp. VKM F-4520 (FW-2644)]|nr:hypothetical protein V502_02995 [Pseudogymnoascus sp. VKM F-4520 (FW-2644)]